MRAVVYGVGKTGSAIGFVLADSGLFSEIGLIDIDTKKAIAEVIDISSAIVHNKYRTKLFHEFLPDSDYVIITAGKKRSGNEDMDSLFEFNYNLVKNVVYECSVKSLEAKILIVTNPVKRIVEELNNPNCVAIEDQVDKMRDELGYVSEIGALLNKDKGGSNWVVAKAVLEEIKKGVF